MFRQFDSDAQRQAEGMLYLRMEYGPIITPSRESAKSQLLQQRKISVIEEWLQFETRDPKSQGFDSRHVCGGRAY